MPYSANRSDLSIDEFREALGYLGIKDKEMADRYFTVFDVDGNGYVDFR